MKKTNIKKLLSLILLFTFAIYHVYYNELAVKNNNSSKKDINYKKTEEVLNVNPTGSLEVQFIDVGQADAILISNNNEHMLIDAGNNEDGPKLVKYLETLGVTNLQFLIGTHAHEDHIGGMDDIIENFNISTFYMPDVITTTKTFEDVLDALADKSIAFETPEIDGTFSFADCKFQVLHVGDDPKDLNDTSIVLRMTYGKNSFLFMGDATSKVEEKILNKNIESDVLKVGHHGSSYSTTTKFLEKVNPNYAIIQVGTGNSYHHPAPSTMTKLKNSGIRTYRTDEDGTIIATSNGKVITFETKKTDTRG